MAKKLTSLGAFAVVVYVLHVILGGLLWDGYNHLMQPISDLTASGAPNQGLLSVITLIYGVAAIMFSVAAYVYTKDFVPKIARVGLLLLVGMHCVSITYGLFPQDLPGSPLTFTGTMHFVVTGLIIPLTILSPILVGLGFGKIEPFKKYARYSIVTGLVILVAGGTTAFFFANKLPYFGLIERINIGVLQAWTFVTSIKLFTTTAFRAN